MMFDPFHHTKPANFTTWAFVLLGLVFAFLIGSVPTVGFAGVGAIFVLSAVLVESNRGRIWEEYVRHYKKTGRKDRDMWSEPLPVYRFLNVYVIWPLVFIVGALAIAAAVMLAGN